MAKPHAADGGRILVANESFTMRFQGADHAFVQNQTRVREGHPVLAGIEHLFKPLAPHWEYEQATAAPGEVRKA